MQIRHTDPGQYFRELAYTTKKYILPFIEVHKPVGHETRMLEAGCGIGGNLLPFIEKGATVTGLDMNRGKIDAAKELLKHFNPSKVTLLCQDFLTWECTEKFDLIFIHDVIEHIYDKDSFLSGIGRLLKPDGVIFMAFPAWQMPFGGHQQIGSRKTVSHLPFVHLLPTAVYGSFLSAFEPDPNKRTELLDIKRCGISIEKFRRLVKKTGFDTVEERLYFVNPHYEVKFRLRPSMLAYPLRNLPGIRNFFSTSCWYVLKQNDAILPR